MRRALVAVTLSAAVSAAGLAEDEALARMRKRAVAEATKTLAKSRKPGERAQAVESLGSWAEADGVPLIAGALRDPAPEVREAAARALWKLEKKAEPAKDALRQALDDSELPVVAAAAGALDALGVPTSELAPAWERVLENGRIDETFLAARGLIGTAPAARVVGPILDYLEESARIAELETDWKERDRGRGNRDLARKALERLVKTEDRSLLPSLQRAAEHHAYSAESVLDALGRFEPRPEGWTELLVARLRSQRLELRRKAVDLLGASAEPAEVPRWAPEVARLLRNRDASLRRAAAEALGDAGAAAHEHVGVLAAALRQDADVGVRREAAQAIGEMGDRAQAAPLASKTAVAAAARSELVAAAETDADGEVREQAVRSLDMLQLAPSEVCDDLARLAVSGRHDEERLAALRALRNRQNEARSVVSRIEALANDPSPRVAAEAKAAVEATRSARSTRSTLTPAGAPQGARRSTSGAGDAGSGSTSGPATAAPDAAAEARGLEVLRRRDVEFDEGQFWKASSQRDAELITAFLDAGLSANHRFASSGESPLRLALSHPACSAQERPTAPLTKQVVRLLLKRGADVNAADDNGNTALMEAALQGCDRELTGILLQAGARIDARNAARLTAFEMGLFSGHDGLGALVDAGYRLPADKAAVYLEAYKANPSSLEMIKRATAARR
jgi:HEAT repeat protein